MDFNGLWTCKGGRFAQIFAYVSKVPLEHLHLATIWLVAFHQQVPWQAKRNGWTLLKSNTAAALKDRPKLKPKRIEFWEFSNDWFLEVPTRCLNFQQFVPENCCPAWHHWNSTVGTWKMGLEEEIPSWKRSWLISTSPIILEKYTAVLAGEIVFMQDASFKSMKYTL